MSEIRWHFAFGAEERATDSARVFLKEMTGGTMNNTKKVRVLGNENGQGLTEYLVLMILISVASITIVTQMGGAITNRFKAAKEKIQALSVNPD